MWLLITNKSTILLRRRKYIRALGGFSYIGTHQYFGQADFLMPELLLKELCLGRGDDVGQLLPPARLKPGLPSQNKTKIQGDQLNMAVFFWYLVCLVRYMLL